MFVYIHCWTNFWEKNYCKWLFLHECKWALYQLWEKVVVLLHKKNGTSKRKTQLKKDEIRQANLFKKILIIRNTNSRRRARERERQNDAHGIVCALAERTNCACEENHLNHIHQTDCPQIYDFLNIHRHLCFLTTLTFVKSRMRSNQKSSTIKFLCNLSRIEVR